MGKRKRMSAPLTGKTVKETFERSDIVQCRGCKYWQKFDATDMFCAYMYTTGRPRELMPVDCYQHEGTPYTVGKCRKNRSSQKGGQNRVRT